MQTETVTGLLVAMADICVPLPRYFYYVTSSQSLAIDWFIERHKDLHFPCNSTCKCMNQPLSLSQR